MRIRLNLVKIFLILCSALNCHSLIHDGFAKVFGSSGNIANVRTTQLLNQLCNESQDDDTIQRDACYGCFFRSSQQPSGYPMLLSMASCADIYLNNTDYGHCREYLRNATSAVNSRAGPTTIYCTFLECIRQVNKDNLDALVALYREEDRWSDRAKFVRRRMNSGLLLRRYVVALGGVCTARRIDEDSNVVGFDAEPLSPRRNDFSDPLMRGRSDKNVFQFFINGRLPRPTFRQYDRVYPREDALFPYKSDHRDLSKGTRYYE